ncbi:MAG: hypothetical protein E7294_02295 [Lachnospiraceae bacterium]|nr:hypothetical protein [Lachnospiraceae bacterium]
MKWKNRLRNLFMCLILICLTGCGKQDDVITELSYVGNAYELRYDYFDSEKTYQFELKAGDVLKIDTECTQGSIDIRIVNLDNEEIYHNELLASLSEDVTIETAGRYIAVLTGKETAGGVHIYVKGDT